MKKCTIILACVLLACSFVFAEKAKKEKIDNKSIVVEAWLVQVKTDALYESGVSPIPQDDEQNVKITNLLWCLSDPNNGKIIASAKTKTPEYEMGKYRLSKRVYFTSVRGNATTHTPYEKRTKFTVVPFLKNEKIRIEYDLNVETPLLAHKTDTQTDTPPDYITVDFNNITSVLAGVPTIVGQSQLDDTSIFLILRAKVEE